MDMKWTWLLFLAVGVAMAEPQAQPERAIILTLKWEENSISVEKKERKEAIVPVSRGFAALKPMFYELQSPEGDVHFSGSLEDPLEPGHSGPRKTSAITVLTLPDIPEARRLVITKRTSHDPDTGRQELLKEEL